MICLCFFLCFEDGYKLRVPIIDARIVLGMLAINHLKKKLDDRGVITVILVGISKLIFVGMEGFNPTSVVWIIQDENKKLK